jgi:type III secretion protein J
LGSVRARFRAAFLVAAPLVGLCAGCSVELEHSLDERQANQVATLLENAGISADKQPEEGQPSHYKVIVAHADVARAFALLEAHDLPHRGQKGLAETFSDSALLPSATEERARYGAALSADLEETLERLPHVLAARVHLALPAGESLLGENVPKHPTASVLLKTKGPLSVSESDLRRLIAGAVPAMELADVNVVLAPAPGDGPLQPYDRLGPLRVAPASRATLATLAASGLVVVLLLSLGLVLTALRLVALRRRLKEAQLAK